MDTEHRLVQLAEAFIRHEAWDQPRINASVQYAAARLTEWGLAPRLHVNAGYNILTAEVGSGERTVVLNGHLDVVPGHSEQFVPQVREGRLYGRGSYDMLGACAVFMDVMRELHRHPLPVRVVLMLVPTEETDGSLGTGHLLETGVVQGDFAICGEPTNLNVAFMAKGVLRVACTVHGRAAHGSRPWEGDNAVLRATDTFRRMADLPFARECSAYYAGPSLNLASLQGGDVINQVPDTALMRLDIRTLPGQQPETVLAQIQSLDPAMELEVLRIGPAVTTGEFDPFVNHLVAATQAVWPAATRTTQHGSADTRYFQEAGIPSVEFGPVGAGHHGPEEYVDIASLTLFRKAIAEFLRAVSAPSC